MPIKSLEKSELPLNGTLVLDFSQFLAGPVSAMRLADLGARVIKIERPGVGDIGRTLAFAGLEKDGDTLSFHIMNRNKESYAVDLKNSEGLRQVWELVK
ncbi:MAG: CoA transferase, partial [Candidatus Fonsibacter sp.]